MSAFHTAIGVLRIQRIRPNMCATTMQKSASAYSSGCSPIFILLSQMAAYFIRMEYYSFFLLSSAARSLVPPHFYKNSLAILLVGKFPSFFFLLYSFLIIVCYIVHCLWLQFSSFHCCGSSFFPAVAYQILKFIDFSSLSPIADPISSF